MARASTKTYLALDQWAAIMGINPLWFNSLYLPDAPQEACSTLWQQYDYQNPNNVSREGLALAIAQAESRIMDYLGYHLLPDWECAEEYKTVGASKPEALLPRVNVRWQPQTVTAKKKHLIAGGQRKALYFTTGTIQTSDVDGDGFDEVASIRVPCDWSAEPPCDPVPLGFDVCELRLFPHNANPIPENEIRPIWLTQSGGNTIINFYIWQIVDPSLLGRFTPVNIDASDSASFLTSLDAYRVYNDANADQAELIWNDPRCPSCNGSGCAACQQTTQDACLKVTNERLAFASFTPATFDERLGLWVEQCLAVNRAPDIVRLWYYSGFRIECACPDATMPKDMQKAIAVYAAALLGRDYCDCTNELGFVNKWRDDLALNGQAESYQIGVKVLDNPFGTTRGAVEAWLWATASGRRVEH